MPVAHTPDNPFQRLRLQGAGGASVEFCPYGAQVLSWQPGAGEEERLFLSRTSEFRLGASIRGGVPVIFPQFAQLGELPKHGFARQRIWSVVSLDAEAGIAKLRLSDDAATRAIWPYAFQLELEICLEPRRLNLQLRVSNPGYSALEFTVALHTYFRVGEVASTHVEGLQGARYRDCVDGPREILETEPLVSIVGEVDRIYWATNESRELELVEPQRRTRIEQSGFTDTVVWNPGAERGAALADLESDGFRHMLCVEAARIGIPIVLAPGEAWAGTQILHAL